MLHKEVTHVKHNQSSVTPDLTHCVILLCMLVQDGTLANRAWWRRMPPRQGYNFTSGSDLMRPLGAPSAAFPFSLLR